MGRRSCATRFDCTQAIEAAKQLSDEGGRGKNIVPLGFIPPEMWLCNPWLMEAKKAQCAGDKAEFLRLVKKFFELFPAFAITRDHARRYWNGGVCRA